MFPPLLLAFSLLQHRACASSSVTWLQPQRSAIVKLDTPGYTLWQMDKATAPMLYKNAENFYWEGDGPSAVLLNLTISPDSKTLFLNRQAVLPLEDGNVPPRITAYQVPANITEDKVRGMADTGLLGSWPYWEDLTLGWRLLELDYDRIPDTRPSEDHVTMLKFRVMGIGAHSRSDMLDARQQKVVHITLSDKSHECSAPAKRSYAITNIRFVSVAASYGRVPDQEQKEETCSLWSWRCPDPPAFPDNAPYYRFIWRARFDEFGRIGSLRHAVVRKMSLLKVVWEDAGSAMMMSFGILMSLALGILALFKVVKWREARKARLVRDLSERDSLLGMDVGEMYQDAEEGEHWVAPPPLMVDLASKEETSA
ncbi:hypothetical protein BU26DRAFT_518172 [Trematosphaeria pertusa]|uniref:Uncharacterized protein n=1 Tax=Trematosphaeria pertusa TaxID=390896 RepID=A0A6A6ILP3_9PLEO|nr:uncharacterized protein BU26DRAFT_518172 [Trematosphaeria pertusa]KAF2251535.1 hypothetical protein BU26DRAFT_518172 [Trematosphaeria pertusa]